MELPQQMNKRRPLPSRGRIWHKKVVGNFRKLVEDERAVQAVLGVYRTCTPLRDATMCPPPEKNDDDMSDAITLT